MKRLARRFCLIAVGGLCVWLAAVCASQAAATILYRCVGEQGEPLYTGHIGHHHGCRRLSGVGLPTARRHSPGFRGVTGAALYQPAARQVGVGSDTGKIAAPVVWPVPGAGGASARTGTALAQAALPSPALRGAVYRVRRADGSLEYTNLAPATSGGGQVVRLFTYLITCMACNLHSPIHWQTVPLRWADYAGSIEDASRRYGVDQALLRAVIHAESAFNARAISLKGAQGLMQLMPVTASEMGVTDAFDPDQNIAGGARYLAGLLQRFHGNIRQVAAAYDAGAGAVIRYGGVPPYAETQVYVQRVELLFHRYQMRDRAESRRSRMD